MSDTTPMNSEREAFQRLLDGYGGDRARWPAAERLRFVQLLARDDAARRMLSEAIALDRLLDRAPAVTEGRQSALLQRMVLSAQQPDRAPHAQGTRAQDLRDRGAGAEPAETVSDAGPRRLVPVSATPLRRPPAPPLSSAAQPVRLFPAMALLAASLAAGVAIGLTGFASRALDPVAEVLSGSDTDFELVLATDEGPGAEDTL